MRHPCQAIAPFLSARPSQQLAMSCLEYKLGCVAGLAFPRGPRFGLALPVTLRCRSIEPDRLVTSSTDREIGYGTVYLECSSGLPPFLVGVPASWSGSSTVRVPVLLGVPYPDSRSPDFVQSSRSFSFCFPVSTIRADLRGRSPLFAVQLSANAHD